MSFLHYDDETMQAIKRLQKLKRRLDMETPQYRIEFAKTVFRFHLYDDIVSHALIDGFGLSGRDFDTCFDMNDGDIVVHGIMQYALLNSIIERAIRATGETVWDHWCATHQKVEARSNPQAALF